MRRASLAEEDGRRIRAVDSAAGASSSRDVDTTKGTTDSDVDDENTSEGVQTTEVVGSAESDPPTC